MSETFFVALEMVLAADDAEDIAECIESGVKPSHLLVYAIEMNAQKCLRKIVQLGGKLNALDVDHHMTALGYSTSRANCNCFELLLSLGADVRKRDKYGRTPLHNVAATGPVEYLRMLIDRGASVHAQDKLGCTALMLSAENGRPEAVECLLAAGADPAIVDTDGVDVLGRVARALEQTKDAARIAKLHRCRELIAAKKQ